MTTLQIRSLFALMLAATVVSLSCSSQPEQPPAASQPQPPAAATPPPPAPAPSAALPTTTAPPAISASSPVTVATCNLEQVNGMPLDGNVSVSRSRPLVLTGWIADQRGKSSMERVWLRAFAGSTSFYATADAGPSRPDLAKSLNDPAYASAGFTATVDASRQPPGAYRLALYAISKGATYLCDNGRRVILE